MKSEGILTPVFVEFIPPEGELKAGILYISMTYSTTAHLCASGCGRKVVLPLSPTRWQMRFDGETVSLNPSIGNWDHDCKSHYWIRNNRIEWATKWDNKRIEAGRKNDQLDVDFSFMESSKKKHRKLNFFERLFK